MWVVGRCLDAGESDLEEVGGLGRNELALATASSRTHGQRGRSHKHQQQREAEAEAGLAPAWHKRATAGWLADVQLTSQPH